MNLSHYKFIIILNLNLFMTNVLLLISFYGTDLGTHKVIVVQTIIIDKVFMEGYDISL